MNIRENIEEILCNNVDGGLNERSVSIIITKASDDYAIDFLQWVTDFFWQTGEGDRYLAFDSSEESFSPKELLSIYKKRTI